VKFTGQGVPDSWDSNRKRPPDQ